MTTQPTDRDEALRALAAEWRANAEAIRMGPMAIGALAYLKCADELEAALTPREDAGWQPIETAPKDGTRFLAVSRSGSQRVDWFDTSKQGTWNGRSQFWQERPKDRYTHWMPLPAAPKEHK